MSKFLRNARSKLVAIGATASVALASAPAFAGEMSEAVSGGVDKAELIAIGVVLMTISGVIVFIRSGRKATGT